ncbi:3-oxoadipate enol-lactonase [Actibacterium atlanticum]|uniref:3-oxoadipate enol-lactonase n=1 Tax=Actibacterium atlanticum TaxID=1461693 RepID=A0A058ZMA3_9RHOB|nr:3-oxoadipate enol-lactonase [Actibacterium atlanticum]KCV81946.1 3-oxoadipate enol-lactonase [Actibacterium atlanticum]
MKTLNLNGVRIAYSDVGTGAPVVFANALGTDMRVWDPVLDHLPKGLRIVRYDMRGHGQSDCPPGPYAMGTLVRDAEALLDALNIRDCVFVGLSLGGMVAQGLAVKRLDQVRAMVLSNTAAKIGTAKMWHDRADAVLRDGLAPVLDPTMERWFTKSFRASPQASFWRDIVANQRPEGYAACCHAIAGTDFYTPTASLTLPTLGIAASHDGSTPADMVRETTDLIKGSQFALIQNAGHLACVEKPATYGGHLTSFLNAIGHV